MNNLFEEVNEVLYFWFGKAINQKILIAKQSMLWWGKDVKTDFFIKEKFGELYRRAVNNELEIWRDSARSQLALIILLDQFSRMIHRDSVDSFAGDNKALRISLEGIDKNIDKSLRPIERVFYYMPLEHTENIDIQNQCIELFKQLLFETPEALKQEFQGFMEFAEKHQVIIERFNRFPHRNKLLNRFSSTEEIAFLTQPDSSF